MKKRKEENKGGKYASYGYRTLEENKHHKALGEGTLGEGQSVLQS